MKILDECIMISDGFDKRTKLSEEMMQIMLDGVLTIKPLCAFRYGIEILTKEIHKLLEDTHTKNVQFIRYMPDVLIIDSKNPENTYFMEFKVADTGIMKDSFFQTLITHRPEMPDDVPHPYPKKKGMTKEDIFNVELTAHEIYVEYEKFIDTVVVGYATFLERGLMANYNKNLDIVSYYTPGKIGRAAIDGSYTRIANIDQRSFIDFCDFMMKLHPDLNEDELKAKVEKAEEKLSKLSKI